MTTRAHCVSRPTLWGCCLALFFVPLVLQGCGGSGGADDAAPGSLELVSVTPVSGESFGEMQLVENGGFELWWAGSPAPSGFQPPNAELSALERVQRGPGSFVARQTWRGPDEEGRLVDQFRVHLAGIRPNTAYELSVTATCVRGSSASVALWDADAPGREFRPLDPEFLTLLPGDMAIKNYRKTFRTRDSNRLVIAFHPNELGRKPAMIEWHEVSLRPVERPQ